MKPAIKTGLTCLLFLSVFYLYLITLHPVYKNNDSPETVAAAVIMGIGHPPGYPLYTIAAKAATLVPAGSYSFRVNLLSSLLAVMCLIAAGVLMKLITPAPAGKQGGWAAAAGVLILATGYLFWSQAIEAKGGIYMLNLFLTLILLYGCFRLSDGGGIKYLYLSALAFGLGLSNHWPSTIILFPVLLWAAWLARHRAKPFSYAAAAGFLLAGLCVYLYLPFRAHAAPALNWGEPKTINDFLWVVLRKAYVYPVDATAEQYLFQLKHFARSLASAHLAAGVFAVFGVWHAFKRRRKMLLPVAAVFTLVFLAVVFLNRTKEELSWIMDIFLIPAFFALGLLVPAGITFAAGALKKIPHAVYAAAFVFGAAAFVHNYPKNNASRDFLAYDFGRAILDTMEKASLYVADGDYNLMPVYYEQEINKNRRDIKFATVSFLIFDWGIRDFESKWGASGMKPFETDRNIERVIDRFKSEAPVYRSAYFPRAERVNHGLKESQKGLLIRLGENERTYSPSLFGLYSYRNAFDKRLKYSKNDMDLTGWFPVSMVNQANSLLAAGRYEEAAKLNKNALVFLNEKPEGNIHYNISLSYRGLNNLPGEIRHLRRAVELKSTLYFVYERLGVLYYDMGILTEAKPMLIKAAAMGASGDNIKNAILVIDGMSVQEQLEIALIKANENISKSDLLRAKIGYEYLLERKYKTGIINMNLGVFYFKTGDLERAVEHFQRSKNETDMPNSYLYLAFVLHSLGKSDLAVKEAEEGLKKFPNDKGIEDFLKQAKAAQNDEKNNNSTDRQR